MAGSPGIARALRQSESSLSGQIREAMNIQAGVRVRRNNVGALRDRTGRAVVYGQGVGSPDLMGAMTCLVKIGPFQSECKIARCFHLEVKLLGEKPSPDQLAWHEEARSRGEFVAVVHSVGEALGALERCKLGAVE
jgi:hypothetical protein